MTVMPLLHAAYWVIRGWSKAEIDEAIQLINEAFANRI
jgi:hypothetical protein